jgi:predicted nucleic acid-binding protein
LLCDLSQDQANLSVEDFARIFQDLKVTSSVGLRKEALNLALTHNMAIYDALYVAATQTLEGILFTADQKLYAIAKTYGKARLLQAT